MCRVPMIYVRTKKGILFLRHTRCTTEPRKKSTVFKLLIHTNSINTYIFTIMKMLTRGTFDKK